MGIELEEKTMLTSEGGVAVLLTAAEAIVKGNLVKISILADASVLLSTAATLVYGVAYQGGSTSETIYIVVAGVAECLTYDAVRTGRLVYASNGHECLITETVNGDAIGVALDTVNSSTLCRIILF